MKKIICLLIFYLSGSCLGGCQSNPVSDSENAPLIRPIRNNKDIMDIVNTPFVPEPDYSNFSICYGNTCNSIATLGLNGKEWQEIRDIFQQESDSSEYERGLIRTAIARLESIVGDKTGTARDAAKNAVGTGWDGQMDCIDESTNSTVYLTMLQNDNLLKWHRVQKRTSRGLSTFQGPHFTAVIRDMQDGVTYAVDSWFLANGEPPFVVPLSTWRQGWQPHE